MKAKLLKYFYIETSRQGFFTISTSFDYDQVKDRVRKQMGNYYRSNEEALGVLAKIHDILRRR